MKTQTMLTINLITIGLALLALFSGCEDSPTPEAHFRARAALALAEAEAAHPNIPREHATPEPTPAARAQPRQRRRRVLYFGAAYCPGCRAAEHSLDLLRRAGWQVGDAPDNHIQVIAVDGTPSEQALARHWRVDAFPTWIAIQDGKEHTRHHGPLDPFEIATLYDSR